jgi:2-polyprenyl-3-methyl-5-hydroxy-6-metoxy-1,4-benzoquinol methylase
MKIYDERTANDYDNLRSGHLLTRRSEIIKDYVVEIKETRTIKIAEVGSGTGIMGYLLSGQFPSIQFDSYDNNQGFINYASEHYARNNLSFQYMDIEKDSTSQKYDIVFSVDMLHHLKDLKAGINNVCKMLKTSGHWIIIEPNIGNPYIYLYQLFAKNEGLFVPALAEKEIVKYFTVIQKKYAFIIHSAFKRPFKWLIFLERQIENNGLLGGSVVYLLKKR